MEEKLLVNESPLIVLPSLAACIGINHSIILQQIHYLLQNNNCIVHEGIKWRFGTYEKWLTTFKWLSSRTLQRIILDLENKNLLISKKIYESKGDRTKWYTVNYEAVKALDIQLPEIIPETEVQEVKNEDTACHNDVTIVPKWRDLYKENKNNTIRYNNNSTPVDNVIPEIINLPKAIEPDVVVACDNEMKKIGINLRDRERFIKNHEAERIKKALRLTNSSNPTNPAGFFRKALEEDWQPNSEKRDPNLPETDEEYQLRKEREEQELSRVRQEYHERIANRSSPQVARSMLSSIKNKLFSNKRTN